jgi:hypothetical protein
MNKIKELDELIREKEKELNLLKLDREVIQELRKKCQY